MLRLFQVSLVAVYTAGVMNIHPAEAVTLELFSSSQTFITGDSVTVDVRISGLHAPGPPSLGAFDLKVGFDPTLLSPNTVAFGPFLGNQASTAIGDFGFSDSGIASFSDVSLLSPSELDSLQPERFSLATLIFTARQKGKSRFELVPDIQLGDAFGKVILVTKTKDVLVPEPNQLVFVLVGLTITLYHLLGRARLRRN